MTPASSDYMTNSSVFYPFKSYICHTYMAHTTSRLPHELMFSWSKRRLKLLQSNLLEYIDAYKKYMYMSHVISDSDNILTHSTQHIPHDPTFSYTPQKKVKTLTV